VLGSLNLRCAQKFPSPPPPLPFFFILFVSFGRLFSYCTFQLTTAFFPGPARGHFSCVVPSTLVLPAALLAEHFPVSEPAPVRQTFRQSGSSFGGSFSAFGWLFLDSQPGLKQSVFDSPPPPSGVTPLFPQANFLSPTTFLPSLPIAISFLDFSRGLPSGSLEEAPPP